MQNYITEFIGTFFLVLTVALAVPLAGSMAPVAAPIAIGSILMVMIYMGGHISGAHYNPAVTLGVLMRGKIDAPNAMIYMAVQIAAGIAAAGVGMFLLGGEHTIGRPAIGGGYSAVQALVAEIMFTFALVSVVLNVATSKATADNFYYCLAIGFTVLAAAYAAGGISGGAFNPAVGLGGNVLTGNFGEVWVYLVGPFVGGALGAIVYKMMNPSEE